MSTNDDYDNDDADALAHLKPSQNEQTRDRTNQKSEKEQLTMSLVGCYEQGKKNLTDIQQEAKR